MSNVELEPDAVLTPTPEHRPPFVVGIGASAGGLEALEKLFEAMPADTGMVFVVIQHLSPDFKSLTDTLLARRTAIPIRQAENGMPVEPDVCYLLPPRKDMILSDGKLLLTDKEPAPTVALPIDRFLRSIAQDAGDRAVAVILSGTGSDGSRGIRDVHAAGGLVIAQAPETAKFDGMPKSAVATGAVDYSLSADEIPAALLRHAEHPEHRELPDGPADGPIPAGMDAVFGLLRDACGIDFAAYKPETIGRRIERRMGLLRIPSVEEYADRLMSEPAEVNLLYKDLLIGVTRFFRDPEAFERLGREVLPRLLSTLGRDDDFRVWVAACATGEEAYTLGMVIQECLDAIPRSVSVKIFATDAHRASLDVAGAGVYPADSLIGMTQARRERFFVPKGDAYQVVPELRKQVVFAQHNVLKDAPFTRLDLIVCRNLLIYFLPPAQKKVLSLFHFGLKTGGALFLGPSEGPGDLADEFDTVNARWKVYRKRRDVRLPTDVRLPVPLSTHNLLTHGERPAGAAVAPPDAPLTGVLDMLLDECLTPAILVNDRRQVVRTFAGASRYLDLRDGWFSADLLDAVRPELRPVLAGAVPRALGENIPVAFKGLPVRLPDGDRVIDVRVKPIRAKRLGRHVRPRHPGRVRRPGPGGRPRDGPGRSLPRTRSFIGGRTALGQREPPGDHRGAGDEQRGVASHQRGTDRVERRTPEHQRRTALGQRGALHGQRGVSEEDRGTDGTDRRHGEPASQHRGPHRLPGPRPVHPQVHPESGRHLPPTRPGHRPADRPLHALDRPPRAARRPAGRPRSGRPDRAAGAEPTGPVVPVAGASVPGRRDRGRGGPHPDRHRPGEGGRGRRPSEGRATRRHPPELPELGVRERHRRPVPPRRRGVQAVGRVRPDGQDAARTVPGRDRRCPGRPGRRGAADRDGGRTGGHDPPRGRAAHLPFDHVPHAGRIRGGHRPGRHPDRCLRPEAGRTGRPGGSRPAGPVPGRPVPRTTQPVGRGGERDRDNRPARPGGGRDPALGPGDRATVPTHGPVARRPARRGPDRPEQDRRPEDRGRPRGHRRGRPGGGPAGVRSRGGCG